MECWIHRYKYFSRLSQLMQMTYNHLTQINTGQPHDMEDLHHSWVESCSLLSRFIFWHLSWSRVQGQQSEKGDTTLPGLLLWEDTKTLPRDIIPPACPLSAQECPSRWAWPKQIPKPTQPASHDMEEQRFYSKLLTLFLRLSPPTLQKSFQPFGFAISFFQ